MNIKTKTVVEFKFQKREGQSGKQIRLNRILELNGHLHSDFISAICYVAAKMK